MNKILVIEQDGEQQTISLAHFLIDSGYEVGEVKGVFRAIAILQKTKFDLILCSQMLFLENLTLLQSIILGDAKHSKIILLREAGEKKSEDMQHSRIIGNIEKPVDREKLLELISTKVHKNGFTGMFNNIDITDYLQLLAMNKATKAFVVESEKRSGMMVLQEGELIYVSYGDLQGESAFHALLSLQSGQIIDKNVTRIPPKNINKPLARLLLEHSTSTDESTVQSRDYYIFEETDFSEPECINRVSSPEHLERGTWQKPLFLCMAFFVFFGLLGSIVWKSFYPEEAYGIYSIAQAPIEIPLTE